MKEVKLSKFIVKKGGSVDPSKYPSETFELYSIPAYDRGEPEILRGDEIGSSKKKLEPGDVIISRIVPHIRRCWIVSEKNSRRQIGSGEWIIFRSKEIFDSFLRYYLLSNQFNRKFMRTVKGVGGSLLRADPRQVEKFKIPLPPLPIQRRIAAALDLADRQRQLLRAEIAAYGELGESLFLEMFGASDKSSIQWPEVELKDLSQNRKGAIRTGPFGSNLLHSEFVSSGIPVLGIDNAVENTFKWKERRYITPEKYEDLKNYRVYPNDIIITIMGTVGRIAAIPEDIGVAINTKHLAAISFDKLKVDPLWMTYNFRFNPKIQRQIGLNSKGAIMDGLNLTIIKRIVTNLPPLALQHQFATRIQKIEALKSKAETALTQADDLFHTLLQRAFRGELFAEEVVATE